MRVGVPLLITRRRFLEVTSATVAIGSPSSAASGVVQNPPAPSEAPALSLPADTSRGPNSLRVEWAAEPGATSYDLEVTQLGASPIVLGSVVSPHLVTGLAPNTDVRVAVRVISSAGKSPWSPRLATRTRPPSASVPSRAFDEMTDPTILVTWDLASTVAGVNGGSEMSVEMECTNSSGTVTVVVGPIVGAFRDSGHGGSSSYRTRVVWVKSGSPGSRDEGFWSPPLFTSKTAFYRLQTPGIQGRGDLAAGLLRSYYGS